MEIKNDKYKYALKEQTVFTIPAVYTSLLMGFLAAYWKDEERRWYVSYEIEDWYITEAEETIGYELNQDLYKMVQDGYLESDYSITREHFRLTEKGLVAACMSVMFN